MEDLLLAIYAAVVDDGAMMRMLAALADAFACRSAAFVFVDRHEAAADISVAIGPFGDPDIRAVYDRDFAAIDPAPQAMIRHGVGRASATDLLFDLSTGAFGPFLDGFYHPIGLAGALGAPLVASERVVSLIAVHRAPDRQPFDAGDVARFDRLVPHLAQMVALRHAFYAKDEAARSLRAALEHQPSPVLVVDRGGLMHHGNVAARRLLASGDGLTLDHAGRLRTADVKARLALASALAAPASAKGHAFRVVRGTNALPYFVRVQPAAETIAPRFIVRVSDPAPSRATADIFAALLGLTGATARLVAALAGGADLRSYAQTAGITPHTARFHLKSAFAATGTRRQTDLVRFVNALQRDLAL